ncbi:OmpW/AlkL family protein [Xanthomonas bundabergensis]|uniref:OmpW/AlkL family protein n=1 Tax=Xanthomonas bundabergensis TaxID=3160842 RepID=UPI0035121A49
MHELLQSPTAHLAFGAMASIAAMLMPTRCVAADVAAEPTEGNWLVRAMALEVVAVNLDSKISYIGGEITTPSALVPGLDVSYFITDHWSVEVQGGVFARDYRIVKSRIGDFDVGTIESGTVSLTVQYHFRPHDRLSPYLGLGVNHAWEHEVKPAAGIPVFHVQDISSAILNLGFDYRMAKHWFFSASLRYVISPAYRFEGYGINATVDLDTVAMAAGVGYRF